MSEDPKLIIRVINFELCSTYKPCRIHQRHRRMSIAGYLPKNRGQTDGQTDERTTYDSNTRAIALRKTHQQDKIKENMQSYIAYMQKQTPRDKWFPIDIIFILWKFILMSIMPKIAEHSFTSGKIQLTQCSGRWIAVKICNQQLCFLPTIILGLGVLLQFLVGTCVSRRWLVWLVCSGVAAN